MSTVTQYLTIWKSAPRFRLSVWVLSGLSLLLIWMIVISVGIGAVSISPIQVLAIVLDQVGISTNGSYEAVQQAILINIRLPRVFLAVMVGAALAISGAAMQGLFRNPLADPGLIGVSSGAALTTAIAIVILSTITSPLIEFLGSALLPIAAFVGGISATVVVYRLSTTNGKTNVATMLLAGIAINAMAGAILGFMIFLSNDDQLRDLTFWTLGSLGGAMWSSVWVVLPFILAAIIFLPRLSRGLNAILLGESEARHLGVKVERLKKMIVVFVGLAVGAAVSVSGMIGFIGLVVPHILRLWIGPDHRFLIPGSAILGGLLLLSSDLLARTIVSPAELPIGVITASIGAPFFLWLLLRNKEFGGYL
ncbi:FecCD family ABC transporter permease [Rhodohalobacter sulfatireducens]|uniref:Iron chelate uptake ABC transporter family permease subunit n=1 Tax=Rhodohalobacter sulfatireducens TaxID=2911366 RepID=A0ABS9KAX9_9BACT|nr:iron chelate uptake ABC transporter family permease subunit [Rhodohalobacter sulfatireducens]MCG2587990.1 iron chelate uptake ABC transporter family permease subunit [Rhodohalobacter sulfatireducens]